MNTTTRPGPGKKQKIVFAVIAVVLLCLPLFFILRSEDLLSDKTHTFRFRPVRLRDPHDPLRGNYLVIDFQRNVPFKGPESLEKNKKVYVSVERDSLGYAYFASAATEVPSGNNYFTTTTRSATGSDIWIDVPFDRYFINENNALLAENVYRNETRDEKTNMYIEVCIRDGESLLKNVYIDSIPLSDYMNRLSAGQREELEKTLR